MKTARIVIYPKDVQIITGKSYRQSLRILQKLKIKLRKDPHQYITFEEYNKYYGIKYEMNWS